MKLITGAQSFFFPPSESFSPVTPSSSLRPCTESHHTIYTNFITPGRLACSAVRHQHLQTLAHHHTSVIIPSSPNCGATSIKIGTFAFDSRSNWQPNCNERLKLPKRRTMSRAHTDDEQPGNLRPLTVRLSVCPVFTFQNSSYLFTHKQR